MSLLVTLLISATWVNAGSELPVIRIGIIRDGPAVRFPDDIEILKQEIQNLISDEFDVRFPADKNVHGNWTASGIRKVTDRLLTAADVDIVITMGVNASSEICHRKKLAKPVIVLFVINAEMQGLPLRDGASGVRNLCYINSYKSLEEEVRRFRQITPFEKLSVLADSLALQMQPYIPALAKKLADELGTEIHLVPVETTAEEALELPPGTDAVYISPLMRLSPEEFRKVVSGLTDRDLPSFSMHGRQEVELGILAGMSGKTDYQRLTRRVALNVERILSGEDAGTLKVAFRQNELSPEQLIINMATARAISIHPPWAVLTESELINEEITESEIISEKIAESETDSEETGEISRKAVRELTLEIAVSETLSANLDIASNKRKLAAGQEDVREARSNLLPHLDIDTTGALIDDDRAGASNGQAPERSWTVSATATQILYSDKAQSNYTVQKHFQSARTEEHEALKLDIVLDTVTAYLDVLRARTSERILKNNLSLTRANLNRARGRRSVGTASPSEVYRWESEVATVHKQVFSAKARTRQVMIDLNRLLCRPLEEHFSIAEVTLENPMFSISDKRFPSYVDNPEKFRIFREFMVRDGLKNSPELRQADSAIKARERLVISADRAYWQPTVSLQGKVTEHLAEGGAGADPTPMEIPGIGALNMPESDDTDWSVGVVASFPLYSGGAKNAELRRSREELSGLRLERKSLAHKIEERIRVAVHQANASYPAIRLSKDAAEAANKNLDLTTQSYATGVVSIIVLLDAQNASLAANQTAASSVYDFLGDMMNISRAVGEFDFLRTPEEHEKWLRRLKEFNMKSGG